MLLQERRKRIQQRSGQTIKRYIFCLYWLSPTIIVVILLSSRVWLKLKNLTQHVFFCFLNTEFYVPGKSDAVFESLIGTIAFVNELHTSGLSEFRVQ